MERAIVAFESDDEGDWVARLACGHTQHVRHKPPMQSRPWVLDPAGRAQMIGSVLDCSFCNMPALPPDARAYHESPMMDSDSVPAKLLADHRTKAGVWGRIVVEHGKVEYHCAEGVFVLRPGVDGIIAPTAPHRVRLLEGARFRVVFLRGDGA